MAPVNPAPAPAPALPGAARRLPDQGVAGGSRGPDERPRAGRCYRPDPAREAARVAAEAWHATSRGRCPCPGRTAGHRGVPARQRPARVRCCIPCHQRCRRRRHWRQHRPGQRLWGASHQDAVQGGSKACRVVRGPGQGRAEGSVKAHHRHCRWHRVGASLVLGKGQRVASRGAAAARRKQTAAARGAAVLRVQSVVRHAALRRCQQGAPRGQRAWAAADAGRAAAGAWQRAGVGAAGEARVACSRALGVRPASRREGTEVGQRQDLPAGCHPGRRGLAGGAACWAAAAGAHRAGRACPALAAPADPAGHRGCSAAGGSQRVGRAASGRAQEPGRRGGRAAWAERGASRCPGSRGAAAAGAGRARYRAEAACHHSRERNGLGCCTAAAAAIAAGARAGGPTAAARGPGRDRGWMPAGAGAGAAAGGWQAAWAGRGAAWGLAWGPARGWWMARSAAVVGGCPCPRCPARRALRWPAVHQRAGPSRDPRAGRVWAAAAAPSAGARRGERRVTAGAGAAGAASDGGVHAHERGLPRDATCSLLRHHCAARGPHVARAWHVRAQADLRRRRRHGQQRACRAAARRAAREGRRAAVCCDGRARVAWPGEWPAA
eukprot:m.107761 g.107761  ORF g.107761 m.107761 type:complete len:608 (-) comp14254_c1_seq1:593-2416(-)